MRVLSQQLRRTMAAALCLGAHVSAVGTDGLIRLTQAGTGRLELRLLLVYDYPKHQPETS